MGVSIQPRTHPHILTMLDSVSKNIALAAVLIYGTAAQLGSYSAGGGGADDAGAGGEDGGLEVNIPGVPGEDYPIYPSVPDTGFTCDGLVEGGYYADPAAECQAFHICANDGAGGLITYKITRPSSAGTTRQPRAVCVTRSTCSPVLRIIPSLRSTASLRMAVCLCLVSLNWTASTIHSCLGPSYR